mmetsp:Transcript_68995/g.224939  ORF Transcript_68995/g.224939 Transcript_68995/m.224939 type:complete len:416 (-) Transcript_68995:2721-3968(-)
MDGQHDVSIVDFADGDARVPCHRAVDRALCERGTIPRVVGVRVHRAHHVCGVDILDREGDAGGLAMLRDLVLQECPDIGQLLVSTRVGAARALDDCVAAPLCDDNDCTPLSPHDVCDLRQKLVQGDVHLGQQDDINVSRRERRSGGDPTAMSAHEFDQADAVRICRRLDICRVDGAQCLRACRFEAEGSVQDLDVVVDCLWHSHHCALVSDLRHLDETRHCTRVSAIASEHEVLSDVSPLHDLCDLRVWRVAAVTDQYAAALHVDILDILRRELNPLIFPNEAEVAANDTIDSLNSVCEQHLGELTNHSVQARAQASACDNRCAHAGLPRIEVQHLACSSPQELHVAPARCLFGAVPLEGLCAPDIASDEAAGGIDRARQRILHVLGSEGITQIRALMALDLGAGPQHILHGKRR